ncbi:MAG: tyrosine-type recombinase/integrase [Candidatus Dadabacteria bacterium]|nr:tyrosine-type recombinase/integrase [Candidatus Dadabacteria bacterium]NIQ12866.1 tyrosine-type recombinase/integrase [Candidatus Dadabacteria bacterium]
MAVFKKNNRWYTDIYADGRRIRQAVKIDGKNPSEITRKDALKVEAIRKAQVAQGVKLSSSKKKLKFYDLIDRYLDWVSQNRKYLGTDKSICKMLKNFFKNKAVEEFNLFDIERLKKHRKEQGRTNETINKDLGSLRRMINLAVDWKLIGENPIKNMKLLKTPLTKDRIFSEDEFVLLLESASKHFKPVLLTFYFTGMRVREVVNLKWNDIDFQKKIITVAESKNNEYRTIPMNKILFDELKKIFKNSNSEHVFVTPKGDSYKGNTPFKTVWNNTLKKSGINHCALHDFRHTFTSNLIVNHKEDYITVMALTGHKSIRMLQRYSHTREESKKNAIDKLNINFLNLKDSNIAYLS